MIGNPDTTHVLSALLEPDGTIRLHLRFADHPEPVVTTIEPIETTIESAGAEARAIHLEYGHECDRHLRLVIAMHADALAYERSHRGTPWQPDPDSDLDYDTIDV
jgi:hypothetical protein